MGRRRRKQHSKPDLVYAKCSLCDQPSWGYATNDGPICCPCLDAIDSELGGAERSMYLDPAFAEIQDAIQKENRKVIKMPAAVRDGSSGHSYSGGHGAGYLNNNYQYTPCKHVGDKIVYERKDGKKLYGTNRDSVDAYSGKWDLIIDLAGIVSRPPNQSGFLKYGTPSRFEKLRDFLYKPMQLKSELLQLDWQDMSAPPVGLAFWYGLWELLPEKTVIGCFGGHGRTGTCMAALLIADGVDVYTAVETVRTEHCSKAIESAAQIKYLHAIHMDRLKWLIKSATDANDQEALVTLAADLQYALDNPPSNGTKDYSSTPKQSSITIKNNGPIMIGGKQYSQECTDPTCKIPNCKIVSHQSYVEWTGAYD